MTSEPGRVARAPLSTSEVAFLEELRAILPARRIAASSLHRELYAGDAGPLHGDGLAAGMVRSVDELRAVLEACRRHGVPFTPRGGGTGLTGGGIPVTLERRPLVISLAGMDRILDLDVEARTARVEPGVTNLALSVAAAPHGLRFAPDPSSQMACTLGGNVATNAGGPHCLSYGVTSNHVLAVDLMDADGVVHRFGSEAAETSGYDLRGLTVGSEGTFGLVTEATLRLVPAPPAVTTVLAGMPTMRAAADVVTDVLASGATPGALEVLDRPAVELVEAYAAAGYPLDAEAVVLMEFEGLPHKVASDAAEAESIAAKHGCTAPRRAESDQERALLWRGRKAVAGAIARVAPHYYIHDVVVPRSRMAEVLDGIAEIGVRHDLRVINVFHAGDGNLHPLLLLDDRAPETVARVLEAGHEIVQLALAAGGALTGEHGVGVEKRDLVCEALSAADLEVQLRARQAMEPSGMANPGKAVPTPSSCFDVQVRLIPEGTWV